MNPEEERLEAERRLRELEEQTKRPGLSVLMEKLFSLLPGNQFFKMLLIIIGTICVIAIVFLSFQQSSSHRELIAFSENRKQETETLMKDKNKPELDLSLQIVKENSKKDKSKMEYATDGDFEIGEASIHRLTSGPSSPNKMSSLCDEYKRLIRVYSSRIYRIYAVQTDSMRFGLSDYNEKLTYSEYYPDNTHMEIEFKGHIWYRLEACSHGGSLDETPEGIIPGKVLFYRYSSSPNMP